MEPRANNACYFASNVMTRLDEKDSTLLDTFNAKKIFVVEAGNPPQLMESPKLFYDLRSGDPF
jgi:hypothetical protein